MAIILSQYYTMDWCVWGLEIIIIPCIIIIEGSRAIPPLEWLDQAWDGMLTAKANLGVELTSGDVVAPQ